VGDAFWKKKKTCGKRRKYCKPKFSPISYNVFLTFNIFGHLFWNCCLHSLPIFTMQKLCCIGKGLILYQMTNFRLFQTERVCRRQFWIWWKWKKVLRKGRKHWEKERLLVTSNFFIFHSVFLKACTADT
jgi:hypothetical protein